MGSYLNPDSKDFRESLDTKQKFVCVSRPRRFGKSMAADMLSAYYGCGEDTTVLFDSLKIASDASYKKHLNMYDVIKVNIQEFLSATHGIDEMLKKYIIFDLFDKYETVRFRDIGNFIQVMKDIFAATKRPFVILIDEWDCLFREYTHNKDAQGAINQIKQKNYVKALEDYKGNLLLAGINYDKDKKHTCVIEKMVV